MLKSPRSTLILALALLALPLSWACAQEPIDYRKLYQSGRAYPEFLGAAQARKELWDSNQARAAVADDLVDRARLVAGRIKLLVVAIDGCSDSASIIPYIALLAERSGIDLRIVAPDSGGRAIMEAHRTPDGRAATPTIVLLDSAWQNVGVLIERPAALHSWYAEHKPRLETAELTRQKLEWYQRDAGVTTLRELVQLLEQASRAPARTVDAPGIVITNVQLLDGTGAPARRASVRIEGDRIAAVAGSLTARSGDRVIDGAGLTLAPGFIDTHSHADRALRRGSDALGALSQGITTVIVGQDGGSPFPLGDFFAALRTGGTPVNVASYVGHGTIRGHVLVDDYKRVATTAEVAQMRQLLEQELEAGALGLSTGLEYDPGIYSARAEVLTLARVTASGGGRYISHIRSEDRAFWDAIDEIIAIGREARLPVQISHVKLAMKPIWGRADSLIKRLDRARASGVDISADIYPYRYWQSGLSVLFPERNFNDRAAAEFALDQVSPPDEITLTNFGPNPAYNGKTLAEIARLRGTDPPATIMALLNEVEAAAKAGRPASATIIAASMIEPDIERMMAWPHTNIATDGELDGRHPRGFGSFPRVLGHYVRARGVFALPDAVRKMSTLSADHTGLRERGRIVRGAYADLVLFDAGTVIDRATPAQPHAVSAGISKVWVKGVLAYEDGRVTGALAGRVLTRR